MLFTFKFIVWSYEIDHVVYTQKLLLIYKINYGNTESLQDLILSQSDESIPGMDRRFKTRKKEKKAQKET